MSTTNKNHSTVIHKKMMTNLGDMWKQNFLTDYILRVEDSEIHAHKVVLASGSDYFRALFLRNFQDSNSDVLNLIGQSASGVRALVRYLYEGELNLDLDNVFQLLQCSLYLQVQEAVEDCISFLCRNITSDNCNTMLQEVRALELKDVEKKLLNIMYNKADDLIRSAQFPLVCPEVILDLVSNWSGSQYLLLHHIIKWVSFEANRKECMKDILKEIKFCLMTEKQLGSIEASNFPQEYSDDVKNFVTLALEFKSLPVWRKVAMAGGWYKPNTDPKLTVFTEERSILFGCFGYYILDGILDEENGFDWVWQSRCFIYDDLPTSMPSSIVYNNFLIVAGGRDLKDVLQKGCWIFDPIDQLWHSILPMGQKRAHFPLIIAGEKVYAIAGCFQRYDSKSELLMSDCECYDFTMNTWVPIAPLPIRLGFHIGLFFKDKIYVTGGMTCQNEECPKSDALNHNLFAFDTQENKWETLAAMQHHRVGILVPIRVKSEECILAFGTVDSVHIHGAPLNLHRAMEYYNPRTNQWVSFEPNITLHHFSMVDLFHSNAIYSLGMDSHKKVYRYFVDEKNCIKFHEPISLPNVAMLEIKSAGFLVFPDDANEKS